MKKTIIVDGKELHLILGKTIEEWDEKYGENKNLWSVLIDELLDDTLEINEDIWYWLIGERLWETDEEV